MLIRYRNHNHFKTNAAYFKLDMVGLSVIELQTAILGAMTFTNRLELENCMF